MPPVGIWVNANSPTFCKSPTRLLISPTSSLKCEAPISIRRTLRSYRNRFRHGAETDRIRQRPRHRVRRHTWNQMNRSMGQILYSTRLRRNRKLRHVREDSDDPLIVSAQRSRCWSMSTTNFFRGAANDNTAEFLPRTHPRYLPASAIMNSPNSGTKSLSQV